MAYVIYCIFTAIKYILIILKYLENEVFLVYCCSGAVLSLR